MQQAPTAKSPKDPERMRAKSPNRAAADRSPIAHLAEDGREHLLRDHLERVGTLARTFASKWGAGLFGEVAGTLHDLGKYAPDFQDYIRAESRSTEDRRDAHIEEEPGIDQPRRGRVDHSSAGALRARELYGPLGELLAFVIAGHHAGLANHPALRSRMERKRQRLEEALQGRPPADLISRRGLEAPFDTKPLTAADSKAMARRFDLWIRMLFSALCDADFLDTEEFFDRGHAARLRKEAKRQSLGTLLARLSAHMDAKEAKAPVTEVNAVRRAIRRAVIEAVDSARGVFTLTVPTGGGKTLAGMEFALGHALAHDLDRVIVVIPYTSILEQNAQVYREAFEDEEAVLEHHSTFDPRHETARSRLAAQNWDVPIVVTTTVQVFESLFARRTSHCRKLHNLARSVIVLDEAQTMRPGLLEPTLEALAGLVNDYGSSLVICTATQPALARASLGSFGFESMREIVPSDLRAFERLRRVEVTWPEKLDEPTPYAVLADEAAELEDVLVITHLRRDARRLTELLDARLGDAATVHLSALMCPEHRSEVLTLIKQRKARGEAVRVVSTQLVEAGVDLDFPIVYRAISGLDSLAQAAGRCNREGILRCGELRVFVAETSPPQGVPRMGRAITEGMLRADPALDLLSSAPHRTYFERLYSAANTDAKEIQAARAKLLFEDVAEQYRLIEDTWSQPIVVNHGRAANLLEDLRRSGPSRTILRALGRFSVNVPRKLVQDWLARGGAVLDDESGVVALAPYIGAYDARFGLVPERVTGAASAYTLIVDG